MASAGCVLGNITVSGFAYTASASEGAAQITADQIAVTPLLAPTGTFGLQFAAPWSVASGQKQGSNISYRVASSTASVQVEQVRLDGSGFQAGIVGSDRIRGWLRADRRGRPALQSLHCATA